MKNNYNSNIWKYYVFKLLMSIEVTIAIFVLFMLSNNLTMKQVMFLEVIFITTIFLLETPSGAFADLFGRKTSIIIASFCAAIGYILFSLGDNFFEFLIANCILSVCWAFNSGADSAFLYDTLKKLKKEKQYVKVLSKTRALHIFSLGIISIASGFLAIQFGYRILFLITAIFFFFAGIFGFSFIEPPINKKLQEKNYLNHLKKAIKFTYQNKTIRNLIIYYGPFAAMGHLTWFVIQPFYDSSNLPKALIGVAVSMYLIPFGLGYLSSNFFIKRIKPKQLLYSLIFLSSFYFVNPIIAISLLFIMSFLCGIRDVFIETEINIHTKSHHRATVLSVQNMSKSTMYAIFSFVIGFVTDLFNPTITFTVMGLILLFFSIISLFLFKGIIFKNGIFKNKD
jgi:MFS family permease